MQHYVWLIPALPFAAFVLTLVLGKWWIKESAHWLPILAMLGSFGLSIAAFIQVRGAQQPFVLELWRWMSVGKFQVPFAFQVDQLTAVMLLVVTGVGLLIFIYSKGYMRGDPGYYRFFAYMSLFAFSMLMLVMAANYLLLYFGWEAVGLCSYYLIGFFYQKPEAAAAGKKAFITNRVGDFGFGLGVMLIFVTFGTLNYTGVFSQIGAGGVSHNALLGISLLLFMGAMGKSAQFPLHVWLPDAMEGPTPVSALIHAATMVTAGVYLVARSSPIFASAPSAMLVVGGIGTFTAIFAAIIGIAQQDIKKVLAYSTISQLGYMFMALGVGAWSAAIFHLVTHAFFKALLFLGAGSVIHSMDGEQDMRCMGGLARRIPVTWITFIVGGLALSGIFPFAGFWSKDEILGRDFHAGIYVIWAVGLIAAFITAFYTFRMIFVTFWGEGDALGRDYVQAHPRESQVDARTSGPAGHRVDPWRFSRAPRQLRRYPEVPRAGVRPGERHPGDRGADRAPDRPHPHVHLAGRGPHGHGAGMAHLREAEQGPSSVLRCALRAGVSSGVQQVLRGRVLRGHGGSPDRGWLALGVEAFR